MRERLVGKSDADEQAMDEEPPVMQQPLIQQSQERAMIQQAIAEVKTELPDEELEVKDEIIDPDRLQQWYQKVIADASNQEPEADEEADSSNSQFAPSTCSQLSEADEEAGGNKEEPEADEEADGSKEDADAHSASQHADALKAWSRPTPPWRSASPSSIGDQQAASSSGNAQHGNAYLFPTSCSTDPADRGLKRPSVDKSPADLWCAHPRCQAPLDSAECLLCTVHCVWRWPTVEAPMCTVHWDKPQRCQTPEMFCTEKGPSDLSCMYCRTHCPDRVNCGYHKFPPIPSTNKTRGKRSLARYESRWNGSWCPPIPPARPER